MLRAAEGKVLPCSKRGKLPPKNWILSQKCLSSDRDGGEARGVRREVGTDLQNGHHLQAQQTVSTKQGKENKQTNKIKNTNKQTR